MISRGLEVPYFIASNELVTMLSRGRILDIIQQKIDDDGYFIVDVDIKQGGRIVVTIDGDHGVGIDYCVEISRLIEGSLDREEEDFELEVSSPGIGQPFKVHRQYVKNIGRQVEVLTKSGEKYSGELLSVNDGGFVIKEEKIVKPEGKKKKELQIIEHPFNFEELKSVKEILKF